MDHHCNQLKQPVGPEPCQEPLSVALSTLDAAEASEHQRPRRRCAALPRPTSSSRSSKTRQSPKQSQRDSSSPVASRRPLSRSSRDSDSTMRSVNKMSGPDDRLTYTPTTNRISRAKKGKRVHACTECSKIFTRAEHLRRHRMNHNSEAQFRCDVYGCSKTFQREDLLRRHKERHSGSQGVAQPSNVLGSESRRPSSTFSVTSVSSVPSSVYANSPSPYQHPMLAPSTQPSMPYLGPAVAPNTPQGPMASSTQTLNASLLSPLAIPPGPTPGPYVPDLTYGASDESPLHSSNSSCISAEFPQPRFPAQMYNIPARSRSGSTMSAPDSHYYVSKSPLSSGANIPWSMEETMPSPAPQVLSSPYEGSFLPPVGSTQRIFAAHVAGTPVFELRYLMVGSLSLSADQNGLGSRFMNSIDQYLEFYWDRFDAICPIVHKSSFSSKSSPAPVVATMTAIGAQYAPSSEARQLAVAVHKRCQDYIAERGPITSRSPLPDIQCVILLEVFAKFRSRRIDVKPSSQFSKLYLSLFEDRHRRSTDPLGRLKSLQNQSTKPDFHYEWLRWIDLEARRRLTLAAFVLDAQQAILFEQDFCHSPTTRGHANLSLSCASEFWECKTSREWSLRLDSLVASHPQRRLLDMARAYLEGDIDHRMVTLFDTTIVLSFVMSSQPKVGRESIIGDSLDKWREQTSRMFPDSPGLLIRHHTCLLSLCTPLRDLLAVTGESWVLGQKLGQTSEFLDARTRLGAWARSPSATRAAWHAAHILRNAFKSRIDNGSKVLGDGLHQQWCVYVSALVCWVYGFVHASPEGATSSAADGEVADMWFYLEAMNTAHWQDVSADSDASQYISRTAGLLACVRQWIRGSMSGLLKEGEEVLKKLSDGRVDLMGF